MTRIDELWEEVSLSVCRVCVDYSHDGCRLIASGRCALKSHFDEVVAAVESARGEQLAPYISALRDRVCSVCKHQMTEGRCVVRNNVDCALDRYYPLVIDAIEQAAGASC